MDVLEINRRLEENGLLWSSQMHDLFTCRGPQDPTRVSLSAEERDCIGKIDHLNSLHNELLCLKDKALKDQQNK